MHIDAQDGLRRSQGVFRSRIPFKIAPKLSSQIAFRYPANQVLAGSAVESSSISDVFYAFLSLCAAGNVGLGVEAALGLPETFPKGVVAPPTLCGGLPGPRGRPYPENRQLSAGPNKFKIIPVRP